MKITNRIENHFVFCTVLGIEFWFIVFAFLDNISIEKGSQNDASYLQKRCKWSSDSGIEAIDKGIRESHLFSVVSASQNKTFSLQICIICFMERNLIRLINVTQDLELALNCTLFHCNKHRMQPKWREWNYRTSKYYISKRISVPTGFAGAINVTV